MQAHPSLAQSLRHQAVADPEGWEATYRQMVLYDLAVDMELGFFLAYYRNFAIPSIAATLHHNAEIIERPMKRSYDTAIVVYELITSGLNSDRGHHMLRLLNHVHRQVPGSQNDFLYVLLTLLVVPIRWARSHAWRQPTAAEEMAATRFYQELGAHMNITGIPTTFNEAEEFFDRYERENVARSPAGAQLMACTVQVLKFRLPAPVRPLTRSVLAAMFDDDRLATALGLPRANVTTKIALAAALNIRNNVLRRRPLSMEPHSQTGEAGSSLYPNGYRLDDIGPENVMAP